MTFTGRTINNLRCTNDLLLIAQSPKFFRRSRCKLWVRDCHEIDEGNGSYITGGHNRNNMLPGRELEQVETFKYLGAIIAQNGY